MSTVIFKIPEGSKEKKATIDFSLRPPKSKIESHAFSTELLQGFMERVRNDWEKDKTANFPENTSFIEPIIRIVEKDKSKPSPAEESKTLQAIDEKEVVIRTLKMKNLANEKGSFILVADAGYGKTTLLRELQYRIAGEGEGAEESSNQYVPVYFHMRDLTGVFSLDALLERVCRLFCHQGSEDGVLNTVRALFDQNRLVFLLDGLDQIEDRSNLPVLAGRDGILSRQRVLLAGRPYVCSTLQDVLKGYGRLELETFSISMARQYLGEVDYSRLRDILRAATLRAPMVLSIFKELDFDAVGVMSRTGIYEMMVDRLLAREAGIQALVLSSIPTTWEFKSIFSKLSYLLLDRGFAGRFPWEIVDSSLLVELGITRGEFTRHTHLGVIAEVVEGSTLPQSDLVFRHQSFQEFFASLELKKRLFTTEGDIDDEVLVRHLEYNKWDEVFFFLTGSLDMEEAKKIVLAISNYDLFFAGRCAAHYRGDQDKAFGPFIEKLFESFPAYDAISTLAYMGTENIIDKFINKMIELLKFKNYEVNGLVIFALAKTGSDRIVDAIINALKSENNGVRRDAVLALRETNSDRAVEPLIEMLKDKDEDVRAAAAGVLAQTCSDRAVGLFIEMLKDKKEYVRHTAAMVLGKTDSDRAVEPLIELLKDKDIFVCIAAVLALGEIGTERSIGPLIEMLDDNIKPVCVAVAWALAKTGSIRAVGPLIELLKDKDPSVRASAVRALGGIGFDSAVGPVIAMFKDKNKNVRVAAARALGDIGSDSVVEALIETLKDKEKDVCVEAARALGVIASDRAVGALIEMLNDKDEFIRGVVVRALGVIGSDRAVEPLIELLKDKDKDVRMFAALALGDAGSDRAVEPLIELLKDKKKYVRVEAVRALGVTGSDRAVGPLMELFKSKEKDICWAAAWALGRISMELKGRELLSLVSQLRKGGHDEALKVIRKAHKRRFLHLSQEA